MSAAQAPNILPGSSDGCQSTSRSVCWGLGHIHGCMSSRRMITGHSAQRMPSATPPTVTKPMRLWSANILAPTIRSFPSVFCRIKAAFLVSYSWVMLQTSWAFPDLYLPAPARPLLRARSRTCLSQRTPQACSPGSEPIFFFWLGFPGVPTALWQHWWKGGWDDKLVWLLVLGFVMRSMMADF